MDFLRQIRQNRIIAPLRGAAACVFSAGAYAGTHAAEAAVVQILLASIAFIMMAGIYPMRLVREHTLSRQEAYRSLSGDMADAVFTASDKKLQTVYFRDSHIYQIRLYMECEVERGYPAAERVLFRLYDDSFSCIYEERADSRTIEKKGFLAAVPDMEVVQGIEYYYEILVPEKSHAVYRLPVADRAATGQTENGPLYIDGIVSSEVSLAADFDYSRPLPAAEIILYDVLIAGAAVFIYFSVISAMMVYDRRFARSGMAVGGWFRIAVSILSLLAAAFGIAFSVVLNRFGGEIWDRLFFLAGILAALCWIGAAVWLPVLRSPKKEVSRQEAGGRISLIWRDYIQTISFGLLFYALCQYVNADRELYHRTNTRWMLIFLAAALLMNYNGRKFINKINAVWLVSGMICAALYCGNLEAGEDGLLLAELTCAAVIAWGILLLTILARMRTSPAIFSSVSLGYVKAHKLRAAYIGLWAVFCFLMYLNRFEKVWVFTATLPFCALLFMEMSGTGRDRFLRNFTNGILVSFGLVILFCLRHRPYHYWLLYRYGGIFHTVACTGMYLAVVFGAALAKLYGKLKDGKGLFAGCVFEYFVTACAAGFILLTMSRTAFLTAAVTVAAVVALTAVTYRKGAGRIGSELGILAAVCAASFPMVYMAVRMVPAVVNDPVRYDIEFQNESFMVYKGDPINSDKYMTVRRFFSTFLGRFQTEKEKQEEALIPDIAEKDGLLLACAGSGLGDMGLRPFGPARGGKSSVEDEGDDISNGRFRIFQDYIRETGIKGHPGMGPLDRKGLEYAHAHNSYLQIAYNFGIIAGVLFLVLCALALWRSARLYFLHGRRHHALLAPFALVVVFGFMSLTEWAFHPCIPAGFSFLLMQVLLMKLV